MYGETWMMLEVVEVLGRAQQGRTMPFRCRCSDGEIYYVKGRDAGRRSLVCEYIAGELGRALGIPVAPFVVAEVPEALLEMPVPGLELNDLGAGPVFASKRCTGSELTVAVAARLPRAMQCDVLAFDWWIRNMDRYLTESGGNPNLLYEPETRELVVIDHNLAFDEAFAPADLVDTHVFAPVADSLLGDMFLRQDYLARFSAILETWSSIIAGLPEEWLFLDEEMLDPVENFDVERFHATLTLCQHDDFWDVK